MKEIKLPKEEFDILVQDDTRIVLYDKVVDKLYECDVQSHSWKFPRGSRTEIITKLTGVDLD